MIVIDVKSFKILKTFRVFTGGATSVTIKSIEFARRGSNFLINGADRVMRVFDMEDVLKTGENDVEIEVDALQRLQDNVNRMQWKKCTFSGNTV